MSVVCSFFVTFGKVDYLVERDRGREKTEDFVISKWLLAEIEVKTFPSKKKVLSLELLFMAIQN